MTSPTPSPTNSKSQEQCLHSRDQIKGYNFNGTLSLKENDLIIDIVQFRKRIFYTSVINNAILEKEDRQFIMYKTVQDLYKQLKENTKLYVNEERCIIIPIIINYKEKEFQIKVRVPLIQKSFNSQEEKFQQIFAAIQKMNSKIRNSSQQFFTITQEKVQLQKEKEKMQKIMSTPVHIPFVGDITNQRIKQYQNNNGRSINMKTSCFYPIYNHPQPLQKKGIYYFKIQGIGSGQIRVGICGYDIRSAINVQTSRLFMALQLQSCYLFVNGQKKQLVKKQQYNYQTIIKTQIDMNNHTITWFNNNQQIHSTQIPIQLISINIYPMVALNDRTQISFINT